MSDALSGWHPPLSLDDDVLSLGDFKGDDSTIKWCVLKLFKANVMKFQYIYKVDKNLKHKDSFGKSENLSKIFFAEILVFDHDYEGKSSSSNGLLWISFIYFLNNLFELFLNCSEGLRTNLYLHVINYTLQGVIIIKSLI